MLFQRLFVVGLFGSLCFGCLHGNYRVVKTVPSAGEVALEGPQEEARQKAEGYMAGRCPGGYDITEEGEAVIGQNSSSETHKGGILIPAQQTSTTTTDKREWRIKYQCKDKDKASTTTTTGAHSEAQEIIIEF